MHHILPDSCLNGFQVEMILFVLFVHRMAQKNPGTSCELMTGKAFYHCCWVEDMQIG